MADAILGSTVQVLVEMAINFARGKIGQSSELEKDLENLKRTLTLIQDVLHDAEKRQVNERSVKHWLEDLECVAFDAENLLDTFKYEMIRREVENQNQRKRKFGFFSFSRSDSSQNVARDATAFMENRETDSVTTDTSFVGRDDNVSAIVTELTATSNNETISVLPIVGMGGIGKTTVARKVFHDLNIEKHFDERMWVCVSDFEKHFDANRLFGLMLESLNGVRPEVASKEAKVRKLKELLDGKEPNGKKPLKYLLVLDDVWSEDPAPWDGFLDSLRGISSAKGSWILVTTRSKQVATITAISSRPCSLEELSDYDCWLILEKKAFGSREAPDDLKELGLEIAKKCQGLPLAASVLGGLLRNNGSDVWQSLLDTRLQNIGGDGDSYITKILKLSFDHLPCPALKKCFAYCSIFPQDFEMERNQLIQLWAAEGFLHSNPRNRMSMEEVGNRYFTILLERNLFQDAEEDDYGNVLNCKMHDLVHDMVQSISDSKTLRLKESTEADFHDKTFRCITTLFLLENRSIDDDGLINFLACLRVLSTASSDAKELPKSIGKLSHLSDLTPLEIGQLRSLQTLPFFNIGIEAGRQIGELRNLKNLSGRLQLRNLELVKSKEEAESANLIGKPNIDELRLLWNEIDNSRNNDSEYNQVLEGLQAHPNLKGLIIERFFGDRLSKWIGELGRLVKFKLQNCKNCKELPTLGNMPFLKSLRLKGLDGVTSIGPSFYGRSGVHNLSLDDMSNLREWMEAIVDDGTVVVFPVLHTMRITNCPQLATFPNHFPRLEVLKIRKTQNGSALMTYICSAVSTLTRLSIWSVNGLTKVPNVPQTSEGPNCQSVLEHTSIDNNAPQHLAGLESLEELVVWNCPSLESISIPKGRKYLAALRKLWIKSCKGLIHLSIPQISESERDSTSSPFSSSECKKLTDLPKGKLCSLTSLGTLIIGPFSKTTTELHSSPGLFDALPPPHPYFPSLSYLRLYGWPHWESLPEQLQQLSALTELLVDGFGVKSLPDWFGKLSSLKELNLYECEKLENLPSHRSITSLTKLGGLWIRDCPLLQERCNPVSSSSSSDPMSEWSKISHIPFIVIDRKNIRG
ncbi:unnamed protein product [Coffea canephora]|uniref:Disease resistance protein RGA3 n=1 Tax=Coffea canephora TaxID=49390 RepID=A0A068U532_COFCA|nr:unnamed protein product [Coffea canephora]